MDNLVSPQFVETANAFAKWRGSDGQLICYDAPTQRVVLGLWVPMRPDFGFLQLSFDGCTRIELPVTWSASALSINEFPQAKQFRIEDPTAGILVVCTSANAVEHKERFWLDVQ